MMISRAQLDQVIEAYFQRSGQVRPTEKADKATRAGGDVQLSPQAKEVQQAQAAVANIPEIRQQLVAELKAAVQEGRYQVDPEAVAGKILERLIVDAAQEDV